ncbi:hypothetical protein GCM10027294_14940 [Marinactinospora endophytica]
MCHAPPGRTGLRADGPRLAAMTMGEAGAAAPAVSCDGEDPALWGVSGVLPRICVLPGQGGGESEITSAPGPDLWASRVGIRRPLRGGRMGAGGCPQGRACPRHPQVRPRKMGLPELE